MSSNSQTSDEPTGTARVCVRCVGLTSDFDLVTWTEWRELKAHTLSEARRAAMAMPDVIRCSWPKWKRGTISVYVRHLLALRYGWQPDRDPHPVKCHWRCGAQGRIFRDLDWIGRSFGAEPRFIFDELEIDHVVPVCRGGNSELENLVLSCRYCNRSRLWKKRHEDA